MFNLSASSSSFFFSFALLSPCLFSSFSADPGWGESRGRKGGKEGERGGGKEEEKERKEEEEKERRKEILKFKKYDRWIGSRWISCT